MVWDFGIAHRVSLLIGLVTIMGLLPLLNVQAQQGGTNLLANGGFEWWDPTTAVWPFQDGIPEVQVCPGWRAFYVDNPPSYAQVPQYWRRPEFRDVKAGEYPGRVRSGNLAAKYFSFAGQHEAGFYQQVSGIAPGTPLRFSVYMQTWSCMPNPDAWNICPTKDKSNEPAPMHTRVGIDPTGGTNPWSANVVWSWEINAYDTWTYFQVEANAQNSTVTVFTYSRPDWTDTWFRVHNDVYVDDASLVALDEVLPTATLEPVAPVEPTATLDPSLPTSTPAPAATPAPTATPRPDGATVHVVQEGDTLGAIALQYQVSVATLLQLNGLTDSNRLSIGQELVIAVPGSTATATPLVELSAPTAVPPTLTAVPPTTTATLATSAVMIPVPTAVPPTVTALPLSVAATLPVPIPTPEAQETEAKTPPWGLVGGIGIALFLGAGIGFVFSRKR